MRAVVVYESMYGNTHLVAESIGEGLRTAYTVDVVPVDKAEPDLIEAADLIVVGGPTHAHGISRDRTRQAAVADAGKPDKNLSLDPDAEGPGLRDWIPGLPATRAKAAAFDTRIDMPAVLTGRAATGIGRLLRHHGFEVIAEPESFLVTKESHLEAGEATRAEQWGRQLAER
jgi:hypothetical protein